MNSQNLKDVSENHREVPENLGEVQSKTLGSSEDYRVIRRDFSEKFGILTSAIIEVKGARFRISREFVKDGTFYGKPTSIFRFDSLSEFVDDDSSKELIEIGWNNSTYGLYSIGKELGLEYVSGSSLFSKGTVRPHYVEVSS